MKYKTELNSNVNKELMKKTIIMFIIALGISLVGLVISFLLLITSKEDSRYYSMLLGVMSFLFVFSLIMLITCLKTIKKVTKATLYYSFFEDYYLVESYQNEEKISEAKLYYKDLVLYKETKNYYFFYINKANALAVDKNSLDSIALDIIKTNVTNKGKIKKAF